MKRVHVNSLFVLFFFITGLANSGSAQNLKDFFNSKTKHVVAIGEIGLDYFYEHSDFNFKDEEFMMNQAQNEKLESHNSKAAYILHNYIKLHLQTTRYLHGLAYLELLP